MVSRVQRWYPESLQASRQAQGSRCVSTRMCTCARASEPWPSRGSRWRALGFDGSRCQSALPNSSTTQVASRAGRWRRMRRGVCRWVPTSRARRCVRWCVRRCGRARRWARRWARRRREQRRRREHEMRPRHEATSHYSPRNSNTLRLSRRLRPE